MTEASVPIHPAYAQWLAQLKTRFRQVQIKAAVAVNTELLQFYWALGADIAAQQAQVPWGSGFLAQLSQDLMREFPQVKGFSLRNLKYIRKCPDPAQALFYVQQTQLHSWSRAVLTHQIEGGLWQRQGRALNNFAQTLPAPQSELAGQLLKDPYVFDFLSLTPEHTERELEIALTEHITQFLLELGAGFAYMGRQVPLRVGEREFFLDLLFYHARLHCYVVVELKTVDFEPEFAGKLNFYLKAVNAQMRGPHDAPTIGLLLCKSRDRLVAEYALVGYPQAAGAGQLRAVALPARGAARATAQHRTAGGRTGPGRARTGHSRAGIIALLCPARSSASSSACPAEWIPPSRRIF